MIIALLLPILTSCGGGGGGGGGGAQTTITPIVISFGAANYAKAEGDSAFNIPVTLRPSPSSPLTLQIMPDGTAQDMGVDYTLSGDYTSRAVMFNTGQTAKNINVTIRDDSVTEVEESFTLAFPDDPPPGYAYGQRTTIVTITDNDDRQVSFSIGTLDVMVGDTVPISLNLSGTPIASPAGPFTVVSNSPSKAQLSLFSDSGFSNSGVDVTVPVTGTSDPFYVRGVAAGGSSLEIVTLPSDIARGFPRRQVVVTVTAP